MRASQRIGVINPLYTGTDRQTDGCIETYAIGLPPLRQQCSVHSSGQRVCIVCTSWYIAHEHCVNIILMHTLLWRQTVARLPEASLIQMYTVGSLHPTTSRLSPREFEVSSSARYPPKQVREHDPCTRVPKIHKTWCKPLKHHKNRFARVGRKEIHNHLPAIPFHLADVHVCES